MKEKHPVTEAMRQVTLRAIRQTGVTQREIAEATERGDAWVTKFLNGSIKNIELEVMATIENLLGISYFSSERVTGERSFFASKVAVMVDTDPAFSKLISSLDEALHEARGAFTPRYIPTKEMTKIGKEIIRLCYANEDKPGKVAREVLKLLS